MLHLIFCTNPESGEKQLSKTVHAGGQEIAKFCPRIC